MTRNSDCPAFQQLWALVSGKLDTDVIDDINFHLATCPDCQGQVQQLQADSGLPVTTEFQAPASPTVARDRTSIPTAAPQAAEVTPVEPKAAAGNGWKGPLIGATVALLVVAAAMLAWQTLPGLLSGGSSPESVAKGAANVSANDSEGAEGAEANPATATTQAGLEGSRLLDSSPLTQQLSSPAGLSQMLTSKFRMGDLAADLPIESIKVSLTAGEGEPLKETVDLHLGLGFPLRLQVAPASEHKPGFAAFPQTSSQTKAAPEISPGSSAWYEFNAKPSDNGLDELARTPQLLRDLRVGDISTIGFASTGEGDWILNGYKIEVNGELFAENSELELNAGEQQRAHRETLDDLLEQHLALARRLEDGQASAKLGLTESALSDEEIGRQLARSAAPVNDLSGIVTGVYPWYSEPQELFATKRETSPISTLIIRLNVAPQPQSGSQNPIYFDAKGKKYLLSGEADPLVDDQPWQVFQLREQDLNHDPLWHEDLRDIGIGMLGSELALGESPDRAAVARVVVEADRAAIYDSQQHSQDQSRLSSILFVPPAHRNQQGEVVTNAATEHERYVWRQGEAPNGTPAVSNPIAPEPPAIPPTPWLPPQTAPPMVFVVNSGPSPVSPPWGNQIAPPMRRVQPGWGALSPLAWLNAILGNIGSGKQRPSGVSPGAGNVAGTGSPGGTTAPGGTASPGGTTRPIARSPPPGLPDISLVRFDTHDAALHDQAELTITWQVTGDASKIARFRVDAFALAPHKDLPTIYPTALAFTGQAGTGGVTTSAGTRFEAKLSFDLESWSRTAMQSGKALSAEELLTLFAQPRVTAFSADGQPIATGVDGPIMPIFPKASQYPNQKPAGLLAAVEEDASGLLKDDSKAAAWILSAPQGSQHAMLFGVQDSIVGANDMVPTAKPIVTNVAARSSGINTQTGFNFSGFVELAGDMRLISNLGFVDGPSGLVDNMAKVDVHLIISSDNPPQAVEIMTLPGQGLELRKLASGGSKPGPLLLLDIPINLAANETDAGLDLTKFAWKSQLPGGLVATSKATIEVSVKVSQQNATPDPTTNLTEAVGFFGTRMVPTSARRNTSPPSKPEEVFTIFAHGTGGHRNGRDGELISELGAAYWGRGDKSDAPNDFYNQHYQKSFLILDGVGTSDMLNLAGVEIGLATDTVPEHPMPGDFDPLTLDKKLKPKPTSSSSTESQYRVSEMKSASMLGGTVAAITNKMGGILPNPFGGGGTPSVTSIPGVGAVAGMHRGTLHGDGWDDNVAHALFVLKQLKEQGKFPKTINMAGWSRGAVTCIKLANAIQDYFIDGKPFEVAEDYAKGVGGPKRRLLEPITDLVAASDLQINMFLIDPVPGRFGINGEEWGSKRSEEKFPPKEIDYQQLPPIVKDCVITLATDEQRRAFAPLDADDIKVLDPMRTRVVWLPFPGIHRTALRLEPRDPSDISLSAELTAVPELVWDLTHRFFSVNNSVMTEDILNRAPFGGRPLSAQDVVERFANVWQRKEGYHAARNGGVQQWAQGFMGPRKYTGYPEQWSSNDTSLLTVLKSNSLVSQNMSLDDLLKSGLSMQQLRQMVSAREVHPREDLFTSEQGKYVLSPGLFINEYHRACFELAYPELYGFLTKGASAAIPSTVADQLNAISGGSELWKQLQSIGISKQGTQFTTSASFRSGELAGAALRDSKLPIATTMTGLVEQMRLLPKVPIP